MSSRPQLVQRRYKQSAQLARNGVELVAVADPAGAKLDTVVRQLVARGNELNNDPTDDPWSNVIRAAKTLRWRRLTQPLPTSICPPVAESIDALRRRLSQLAGTVADDGLLGSAVMACDALQGDDSPVWRLLLDSIDEIRGRDDQLDQASGGQCIVVALTEGARRTLDNGLPKRGVHVTTARSLIREQPTADKLFVVGPPRFADPSIVTAPTISDLTFVIPDWFSDRSVPRTPFSERAAGRISPTARLHVVGHTDHHDVELPMLDEKELGPRPVWPTPDLPSNDTVDTRVTAQRAYLSGGYGVWLDNGERIRTLDPLQPPRERVSMARVEDVVPGSYLVLRRGAVATSARFAAASEQLGAAAGDVQRTQQTWKTALVEKLGKTGTRQAIRELRELGVKAHDQVESWVDESLARPQSDDDFVLLLEWLGIDREPSFANAAKLRAAFGQVSWRVRRELEEHLATTDLRPLIRDGVLWITSRSPEMRDMGALRVLALSQNTYQVPRGDVRIPEPDPEAVDLD